MLEREYAFKQNNMFFPSTLGVALVAGYDAMGFELSKPFLRAQTEMELRLICDGTKTKADVLRRSIEQYREVFTRANNQVGKLAEVRAAVPSSGPRVKQAFDWVLAFGPGTGGEKVCPGRRRGRRSAASPCLGRGRER